MKASQNGNKAVDADRMIDRLKLSVFSIEKQKKNGTM